jgi:HD superfamily phosphohydrolase
MTYLVYPGATHKRFEHSLGVMELTSRVFDVITQNLTDEVKEVLIDLNDRHKREYWRRVLRMAALTHDIGHLPFSHAAEDDLLPKGWSHETLTAELIRSDEMKQIWQQMKIDGEDVVKLAVGAEKLPNVEFTALESILSEIITGDALGVDRMDYLLRDSHHTGVAYGKFDHYRLVDTLRILPLSSADEDKQYGLGIDQGGIQSAEALMLARYLIYSQVYCHPIRRIYDIHLKDFMKEMFIDGGYPISVNGHLSITDIEVINELRNSENDQDHPGHIHATRITRRRHFKKVYSPTPSETKINPEAGKAMYLALSENFGPELFRYDWYVQKGGTLDFPVSLDSRRVDSSLAISEVLNKVPIVHIDYVYADRDIFDRAYVWVNSNRETIIRLKAEGDTHG